MNQNELVTILVVVAIVILIATIGVFDRRRRRNNRSVLSGMVGTFDEVFHPEAARAAEIREVQRELPAENATPGDPLEPNGTITISIRSQVGDQRLTPPGS